MSCEDTKSQCSYKIRKLFSESSGSFTVYKVKKCAENNKGDRTQLPRPERRTVTNVWSPHSRARVQMVDVVRMTEPTCLADDLLYRPTLDKRSAKARTLSIPSTSQTNAHIFRVQRIKRMHDMHRVL